MPIREPAETKAGVYSEATAAGKALYVSEYGDNDITGLTMASIITYEISTLHPTGWTYWQALDADGKDKNWGMINASDSALTIGPVEPKYYVMAQYSRHIRQGMTIISSGDANSLAAYDPVAQKLVIVTGQQRSSPNDHLQSFQFYERQRSPQKLDHSAGFGHILR